MVVAASLLLGAAPAYAQKDEREAVAVVPIEVKDVVSATPETMSKFTSYFDSVVAASGFRTVPQSTIKAQLEEQQKESYKNCYDEACQIQLGQAVAAQKVLNSTWARLGDACVLSAKLYDLKTGLAEFSTKADGACDEAGLRAAIDEVGQALKARSQAGYGAFTLDLNAGRNIKNPPTDKTGFLFVSAEAKGRPDERVEVYINGDLAGTTPFQKELPVGQYVVILRTAGDRFAHKRFDVALSTKNVRIPKDGKEQLLPMFGTLVIEGSPAQATALINGEPRALSGRYSDEWRIGTYRVVVEAPGYLPAAPQEVKVPPGEPVRVSYSLVRNAGSINISGSPAGAQVVLDNLSVGTVPMTLPDVGVGDHVVEVQAPGHYPDQQIAKVQRGAAVNITVQLKEKHARLKVEAVAKVMGNDTPVEADVLLDGDKVGTTPWKGELRAEVKHKLQLRLGKQVAGTRDVELPEGREQREVIVVPDSWGGAVSSLRFALVPGPWEVRSGPAILKPDEANPVRPGRVPVEFLLDGKMVGRAEVVVSPDENHVISITARPLTEDERSSSVLAWRLRKWLSLGAAVAAGAVGTERILAAHRAESDRDQALTGLRAATTAGQFDTLRAQVVDQEGARGTAEVVGFSVLGGATALLMWSGIEWIWGEPSAGKLEGEGVGPVTVGP